MDRIRLKIYGASEAVGIDDFSLLILVDEAMKRQLVVMCDKPMGKQVALRISHQPEVEKLLPETVGKLLSDRGITQQLEVEIVGQNEGEYITLIRDVLTGKEYPIRCSDGVLFSLVNDVPLYASQVLMRMQSADFVPGDCTKVPLPINIMTEKILQMSLKQAIEKENFEIASRLRDELKRRHHDDSEINRK